VRIFIEDSKYPDRVTHGTGYAEVHRGLILALDDLEIETHFPPCADEIQASPLLAESTRARLIAINRTRCPDDEDTVYLQVATPDSFVPRPGRFSAGLTMTERESLAYYAERFDWVGLCNAMDLVLTPTEWNRAVFERHGIRNVVVAPLGIDLELFAPRRFGFLSVMTGFGRRGSRSNWADIVDAYRTEFRGQEDVRLTILGPLARKPFEYEGIRESLALLGDDIRELLRARSAEGDPPVEVRDGGGLSQEAVRAVYQEHDCYVSYSREGWGLPILEAMACSLDVVACDYGAPMAYLSGSPARIFGAGSLTADNLKFEGGDVAALRRHLRESYEERRRSRRWVERMGWETAARGIERILRSAHAVWKARGQGR
jgi:glycosyltransferase involved in cell wall biosynthesis